MNKYLEQLVELSAIDKDVDAFEPRIQEVSAALKQLQNEHQNLQNNVESLGEEIKENEVKKSQHDLHLKELNDKIKEIAKKMKSIKSEKEEKALNLEEEIAKEQIDFANEEIERLEKVSENKKEEITSLEEKLKEVEEKTKTSEASIAGEIEGIEKEREACYAKKQKLVGEMNQKTLTFYEKIRKWAKNTAVVPVKKQACYGCFMKINDKTYSAVIASEDIITCPHCGRILYKEPVEEEQPA